MQNVIISYAKLKEAKSAIYTNLLLVQTLKYKGMSFSWLWKAPDYASTPNFILLWNVIKKHTVILK